MTSTAEANQANKEAEPINPDYINLKVKSEDGQEIYFKIKRTTPFKKLMDTYCHRAGHSTANVRFLFDGQRINQSQAPKDLNMQNGDEIDVVMQQIGG